jgi:hypothetical protein
MRWLDSVLRGFFIWSGKTDLHKEPSAFRACLFNSAFQFLNVFAALMLYESLSGVSVDPSPVVMTVVLLGLLGFNWFYAASNSERIFAIPPDARPALRASATYAVVSLALFACAGYLLYRASRGP